VAEAAGQFVRREFDGLVFGFGGTLAHFFSPQKQKKAASVI
jgi:hypothetical protein